MFYIRTTYHPSGRYTCMARQDNERMWQDLPGKFFGNTNKAEFYEEVSFLLKELRSSGDLGSFDDLASTLDK
jgi:hypothetical protein